MFGLELRTATTPTQWLTLRQDRYLVSANASFVHRVRQTTSKLLFNASGIDDRDDSLTWLSLDQPSMLSWMDIAVVDTQKGSLPKRRRRASRDWTRFFERLRERDRARVTALERRLAAQRSSALLIESVKSDPPTVAFLVLINGRESGRFGLGVPGTMSVSVYAKQNGKRRIAGLSVHGGEQLGTRVWRWHSWPGDEVALQAGDRVRIQIVPPRKLVTSSVRRVDNDNPTMSQMSREIASLRRRLKSRYYEREAANMRHFEAQRPPPRRYSLL